MVVSAATAIPLTAHEALSGILGSISIACWIFLLVPQLVENYRNASATALSLPFLFIWFLGDVCNLVGAARAGLVPTVVAIAVYFCVADGVLIGQCGWYWYYNSGVFDGDGGDGDAVKKWNKGGSRRTSGGGGGSQVVDGMGGEEEEEPLLARQRSGSITIPGSGERRRRRSSRARSSVGAGAGAAAAAAAAAARRRSSQADHLWTGIVEEERGNRAGERGKAWMKNLLSLLAIVAVGTAGWAIAWGSGAWRPTPVLDGADSGGETGPLGAQLLGYASALAYLGARIPQIVKNARDKSCEGLSLLFFILSLTGNLTYGAGIIFHSLDRDYLVTNVPWLIGSLGTMVEDVIIFVQFHIYAHAMDDEDDEEAVVVVG